MNINKTVNKLNIETININDLVPYQNNAKKHPQKQIDKIKKSIEEFGFNDPIAIDENNMIIEGHGRYEALRQLEYENVERVAGETKWSFWKLLLYAIDGIVAFTTIPLTIAIAIGFIFCLIAFIMIIVVIVKTLAFGDPTTGWPSLACIIFMVSGIQLLCIGVIGEYLSKMYLEVKNRPIYIVKESNME